MFSIDWKDAQFRQTAPGSTTTGTPVTATLYVGRIKSKGAEIAMAATLEDGRVQVQPVFCLLKASLLESLLQYLNAGERKIDRWTARHRCTQVVFDDAQAFANANTLEELQRLQRP